MEAVKRNDIAEQLRKLEPSFREMSDEEFSENFKKELPSDDKELQTWDSRLRKFLVTQHKKVEQHLNDEEEVSIESVYVPLTIIKQKPRPVDPQDETTYSEIAFQRKIANKEIDVTPVDFTEEISEYDPSQSETWCLIENPVSGKSFLCQRTSLRFGRGELSKFSFPFPFPAEVRTGTRWNGAGKGSPWTETSSKTGCVCPCQSGRVGRRNSQGTSSNPPERACC